MPEEQIDDFVDKPFSDKIPDISFELFARLIPGIFAEMYYYYLFDPIQLSKTENSWTSFLIIAYLVGHLIQPFSSGILQRWFSFLSEKKSSIVVKAYSELVGFFSSFIAIFALSVLYFFGKDSVMEFSKSSTVNIFFIFFAVSYLLFATILRFLAVKRKMRINGEGDSQEAQTDGVKTIGKPNSIRDRLNILFQRIINSGYLSKRK